MNRFTVLAVALFSSFSPAVSTTPSEAAPPKKMSAPMRCPKCMMKLSTRRDAAHPTAVRINGKTFYCCSLCKGFNYTSKPVKKAPGKKAPVKSAAVPICPQCRMQMVASKSLLKSHPIKVNGTTYYCCTICPRHTS